jgi:hypothetical protein
LGCEPTKEISRQAANEWWQRKQAEIDEALGTAKRHPANLVQHYQGAIAELSQISSRSSGEV